MRKNHLTLLFLFCCSLLMAQDSLLIHLISKNHKTLKPNTESFYGDGWDFITEHVKKSKNVLIGEDHFSNEIPQFVKALSDLKNFDNFYIEVDPFSTEIIEKSLKKFSEENRLKFNSKYSELFSFYSFKPEYDLLKHISDKGIKILGSDQVVGNADQLIFEDLISRSQNDSAKKVYREIANNSKDGLKRFYEETKNPMDMYFMSEGFVSSLNKLKSMNLSSHEAEVVSAMKKSIKIYKEQNHYYRVRLILNQLMKDYPLWKNKSNLFKYGANHLTRGESFLGNYDVGNLVANITESNFEESFHIMIVGESGQLGSIFKIFPPRTIDKEKDFYLSYLKPFFFKTNSDTWHVFNLKPLRKQVLRGKLKVDNLNLERVIRGYDVLIIIPEVTPAKLLQFNKS